MKAGLHERTEFVSYAIRARLAAFGAGSIRENRVRDGGLVVESFIPGTRIAAAILQRPDGRLRGMMFERGTARETGRGRFDLGSDFDLALFMHEWDLAMMRAGIGGLFYPACLFEFLDRLIFDEREASIASLAPGVLDRRGMTFPWASQWRASDALAFLADQYAEDRSARPATRRAAAAVRGFIEMEEDVPFHEAVSRSRWIGQVMRMMLASGREVPSPLGVWKEALGRETVRSAIWLMCANLRQGGALARRTLAEHVSAWSSAYPDGGCDHFILMNGDDPVAVASVSVDGRVSSVAKPGLFPDASGNPLVAAEERLLSATR